MPELHGRPLRNMNSTIYRTLVLFLSLLLVSCDSKDPEEMRQKVSLTELEASLNIEGQEFMFTVGTQSEIGPYEVMGGLSGSRGNSTSIEGLRYDFPDDDREYIVRKFRNPDGTVFMKVSRFPKGSGNPNKSEQGSGDSG